MVLPPPPSTLLSRRHRLPNVDSKKKGGVKFSAETVLERQLPNKVWKTVRTTVPPAFTYPEDPIDVEGTTIHVLLQVGSKLPHLCFIYADWFAVANPNDVAGGCNT